jgi:hypothetical protein
MISHSQGHEETKPTLANLVRSTSVSGIHWRFSDAGRPSASIGSSSRRPKTLYERELVKAFPHGAYQFSNAKGMRRTRTSDERGRKYTLGRRDSKPSVALVLQRSSTPSYTAEHPTDINGSRLSALLVLSVFSRSSVDVHGLVR